jgi:small subunit ribosomal protein S3
MGQKVRPTGFRTGIMRPWRSTWYASKQDYSALLLEDAQIRKFVASYLTSKRDRKEQRPAISEIRIERTREQVTVIVTSSRVGAIIGKKGEKIEKLTKALEKLTRRHIEVKTVEVTRPEIDAQLIAEDIAEQLERRASFRRTMKQAMQRAMENGAKGVKLQLSGRLGGAEMARCEKGMEGSIPLSTLRCKVEYGFSEAATPQGNIGIKVWVNQGDYLTGEIADATDASAAGQTRRRGRRGPGGGDRGPRQG